MTEPGIIPTSGHLYRLRSRNLPYGVYDGKDGFIGIREKMGDWFLFTEFLWKEKSGTAVPLEDLGPVPDGIVWSMRLGQQYNRRLYRFLAQAESERPNGRRALLGIVLNSLGTEE